MHRRVATFVLLAVFGVAACSSSGGSAGDVPDSSSDVTVADPVVSAVGSSDTIAIASAPGGDFCAAIGAIQTAEFELEETFGPTARQLFDDVQSASPPEISGDVAIVIDTLEAIAELGISTDEDDPEALDAAFEILLDPEFTEANERLEEYTSDTCGIDLGNGDETDLDDLQGSEEV